MTDGYGAGRPAGWGEPEGHRQFPHAQPGQHPQGQHPQPGYWHSAQPGPGGAERTAPMHEPPPSMAVAQEEALTRGFKPGRLALVTVLAAVVAAGGFAVWRALASPGGAGTPEEAAAATFQAVNDEDLLGMIEMMLPSERTSMIEPTTDLFLEMARLDLLSDAAVDAENGRLADFSGFDISIPIEGEPGALTYDIETVPGADDIRWVTVTGGQITVTFNPDDLEGLLGQRLQGMADEVDGTAMTGPETETFDMAEELANGDPLRFAVVEENGSWYASLWYSVAAEATDYVAPDVALAPQPDGADSPEAAAAALIERVVSLDARGTLAILDPEEFRAAYDYWDLYSAELLEGWDQARLDATDAGVTWDVVSVETSAEERNGRTVAVLEGATIKVLSVLEGEEADLTITIGDGGLSVDGQYQNAPLTLRISDEQMTGKGQVDGESFEFDLDLTTWEGTAVVAGSQVRSTRVDDCLEVDVDGEIEMLCGPELDMFGASTEALEVQAQLESAFEEDLGLTLTTVERDGKWYVSAFPTVTYWIVDALVQLEPEEIDSLVDAYSDLFDSYMEFLQSDAMFEGDF